MTLLTLLSAAAIAFSLGIVAAVIFRIGGLVLIVFALAGIFAFRWISGYAHPTIPESIILLVLLQTGYLAGALTPLADRIRRGEPAAPLKARHSDEAE